VDCGVYTTLNIRHAAHPKPSRFRDGLPPARTPPRWEGQSSRTSWRVQFGNPNYLRGYEPQTGRHANREGKVTLPGSVRLCERTRTPVIKMRGPYRGIPLAGEFAWTGRKKKTDDLLETSGCLRSFRFKEIAGKTIPCASTRTAKPGPAGARCWPLTKFDRRIKAMMVGSRFEVRNSNPPRKLSARLAGLFQGFMFTRRTDTWGSKRRSDTIVIFAVTANSRR